MWPHPGCCNSDDTRLAARSCGGCAVQICWTSRCCSSDKSAQQAPDDSIAGFHTLTSDPRNSTSKMASHDAVSRGTLSSTCETGSVQGCVVYELRPQFSGHPVVKGFVQRSSPMCSAAHGESVVAPLIIGHWLSRYLESQWPIIMGYFQ